ncbi:voltage-gated chloride channel protein [Streptococcus suis]|uniref:Chloride channel protein n=1 Tax=Streptococcus suivaginalis TaxID=3028082 RepID=A0AA96VEP6_9STRE|nr:chloride channel protein [Streptococcus sp. 29896]MCK4027089.1 voltage-gated chloride channel protein [Streptococcus suis]WNY47712.1 chloride channel protein [Streptococcus sp. 29896]
MKNKILNLIVYVSISLLLGLLAGAMASFFGHILLWIGTLRNNHLSVLLPGLVLAGLLIVHVYQKWGRNARAGMSLVFEVAQGHDKKIPLVLLPLIMMTTWLSHLFGASVGREGVAVQMGAAIAQAIEKWTGSAIHRPILIKMGMAAGFAGLFQTPLAASIFAVEVLAVGKFAWKGLPAILLAAFTAAWTSNKLGLEKFQHSLYFPEELPFHQFLLLGLAFGFIGNLFALSLDISKKQANKWLPNPYLRMLIMGVVISALLFFHQGRYTGLGTNLIEASLSGETVYSYDWIIKFLFTVLCLTAGFQGGEVTPLFSIGASSGAFLASLLGFPISLAAGLGYTAVFAAATNTLIAPILIAYEVFGPYHVIESGIVVGIAYILNRKTSIYSQQIP